MTMTRLMYWHLAALDWHQSREAAITSYVDEQRELRALSSGRG